MKISDDEISDHTREVSRIRSVYAGRDKSKKKSLYGWYQNDVLLNSYRIKAIVAQHLARKGWCDLSNKEILDVGCGNGAWLRTIIEWGGEPDKLHGVDLLESRIDEAKKRSPHVDYSLSNGCVLPFPDKSMDMICAHTVFSSILDQGARDYLAMEMIRVLRSGGLLLIYDFCFKNPANDNVVKIDRKEVSRLFPKINFETKSLTLAPPIQRRLAPFSPLFAHLVEVLFPILRTHICHFGWLK